MASAYRIGLVRYRNFGPFAEAEVDFSLPGLTGVEGVISWKPGSNSNGSGKSYLLDGPAWCVWGSCLRADVTGDDVVRTGSSGGTMVETTFVGAEPSIRVTRYRQVPKEKNRIRLEIDGVDRTRGTDAETQAVIDHMLFDRLSAQNCLFFGAREDVRSFFSATDGQRKEILDQIFGLDVYTDAEKVARRRLAEVGKALGPLREKRAKIEGELETHRASLVAKQLDQDADELRFNARLATLRRARCEKAVERRAALVAHEEEVLAFEHEQSAADVAAYEKARKEHATARSLAEQAARKANSDLSVAESTLTRLRTSLQKHEKATDCAACGQDLPKAAYTAMHAKLKKEVASAAEAAATARSAYGAAVDAVGELVEPTTPAFPAVELAHDCLMRERKLHAECVNRLTEAQGDAALANELLELATTFVTSVQAKIVGAEERLAEVSAGIVDREALADRLTFWVEGFGNQGLRSFLIESEIHAVNVKASTYAQRLLGTGATVQISATTQLKTKDVQRDKLSIVATIPGCSTTYASASKGQKRRLDLALLLAFRDIVADRSAGAFRQFFADELFDGLDQTGTEYVVELLREIAARDCPVILVTHNLQLKSAVDRVVTVRHEKEYLATVTTSSGMVAPKAKKKMVKVTS